MYVKVCHNSNNIFQKKNKKNSEEMCRELRKWKSKNRYICCVCTYYMEALALLVLIAAGEFQL